MRAWMIVEVTNLILSEPICHRLDASTTLKFGLEVWRKYSNRQVFHAARGEKFTHKKTLLMERYLLG